MIRVHLGAASRPRNYGVLDGSHGAGVGLFLTKIPSIALFVLVLVLVEVEELLLLNFTLDVSE